MTLSGQGNGIIIADAIRIVPSVTTQTQNNTYFVYTDHLDTPREIRNYTNQLRWTWYAEQAEAFGANVPNDNPNTPALGAFTYNLRFPGQIYDAATGLSYNDNRIYVGRSGRYLTSDPIGLDAGQMSTYTYVDGNPLSYVDPSGLAPKDKWFGYNDKNFQDWAHKEKQDMGRRPDENFTKEELDDLWENWKDESCPRGKGGKSGKGGQNRERGSINPSLLGAARNPWLLLLYSGDAN